MISLTRRYASKCQDGCAASQAQTPETDMSRATLDRIITEGKQLGVYCYTILGGEPLLRFNDLAAMARKHSDCFFQVFTGGSLLTAEVAAKLHELGNVVVLFTVSGTREQTDELHGPGTYDQVLEAMRLMRSHNLMFGVALGLNSQNSATLISYEFLKFWEAQGAVFGWSFHFMPVGSQPDLSLMPSPEQRLAFGEFIKRYREEEPLFILDLLTDAPALGGCTGGGRRCLHINTQGDIEPCFFAQHATHNIHVCSLKTALQSPFFSFIRMSQPPTDNCLRPCMLIDKPEIWRTACKRFGAKPTADGAAALVNDPSLIKAIDDYALAAAKVLDPYYRANYQAKLDETAHKGCA